jgi:hypothetical protein
VVVLAKGRLMYCGPRTAMVPWFDQRLGYTFDPDVQGLPADWVMDLVNIDFQTSAAAGGLPYGVLLDADAPNSSDSSSNDKGSSRAAVLHRTMTSMQELQEAADMFQQHWTQQQEESEEGWQVGDADQECQEPCDSKDVYRSSSKDADTTTGTTNNGTSALQPKHSLAPTSSSPEPAGSSSGSTKGGGGLKRGAAGALRRSLTAATELVTADSARPRCGWWKQIK